MGDTQIGDWKPPNESEMKVLVARRERNDQISRLMASYMLKGYRMLDSVCSVCQTVLLQAGSDVQNYCVTCQELESENAKIDNVSNEQLASKAASQKPQEQVDSPGRDSIPEGGGDGDRMSESEDLTGTFGSEESTTATSQEDDDDEDDEDFAIQNCQPRAPCAMQQNVQFTEGGVQLVSAYYRLKTKIDKLSQKLTDCNGLAESKEICDAIKACADTALSIKKLL